MLSKALRITENTYIFYSCNDLCYDYDNMKGY